MGMGLRKKFLYLQSVAAGMNGTATESGGVSCRQLTHGRSTGCTNTFRNKKRFKFMSETLPKKL